MCALGFEIPCTVDQVLKLSRSFFELCEPWIELAKLVTNLPFFIVYWRRIADLSPDEILVSFDFGLCCSNLSRGLTLRFTNRRFTSLTNPITGNPSLGRSCRWSLRSG
jgi:hypothetical protein